MLQFDIAFSNNVQNLPEKTKGNLADIIIRNNTSAYTGVNLVLERVPWEGDLASYNAAHGDVPIHAIVRIVAYGEFYYTFVGVER